MNKFIFTTLLCTILTGTNCEARIPKPLAECILKEICGQLKKGINNEQIINGAKNMAMEYIYTTEGSLKLANNYHHDDVDNMFKQDASLSQIGMNPNKTATPDKMLAMLKQRLFPSTLQTSCMAIVNNSNNVGYNMIAYSFDDRKDGISLSMFYDTVKRIINSQSPDRKNNANQCQNYFNDIDLKYDLTTIDNKLKSIHYVYFLIANLFKIKDTSTEQQTEALAMILAFILEIADNETDIFNKILIGHAIPSDYIPYQWRPVTNSLVNFTDDKTITIKGSKGTKDVLNLDSDCSEITIMHLLAMLCFGTKESRTAFNQNVNLKNDILNQIKELKITDIENSNSIEQRRRYVNILNLAINKDRYVETHNDNINQNNNPLLALTNGAGFCIRGGLAQILYVLNSIPEQNAINPKYIEEHLFMKRSGGEDYFESANDHSIEPEWLRSQINEASKMLMHIFSIINKDIEAKIMEGPVIQFNKWPSVKIVFEILNKVTKVKRTVTLGCHMRHAEILDVKN